MPKKLAKKVVKQVFELPTEVAKGAVEQTGVVSPREEEKKETELSQAELEEKKRQAEVAAAKRAKQLEEEIEVLVKEREEEKTMRKVEPEEPEEEKKPLVEPPTKRPRKFLAGLKRRQEQAQPETVGRRVSG